MSYKGREGVKKLRFHAYVILERPLIESEISERQKLIFSLSQDLFIKNILLIKHSSFIDNKIISFAKSLSQSNIYTSLLAPKDIKLIMDNYMDSKEIFPKTLILTFNEEFNNIIYELISGKEMVLTRFLWLIWSNDYETQTASRRYYIPYNTQLLIVKEIFGKSNISYISEIYHPRVLSPIVYERDFGVWLEVKGLVIFERDLYKRRFNMNGTVLNTLMDLVKI